ncbi:MAG: hypothetical protein JWP64_6150 [Pseudonocardia sp.]|jgi:uncharacterized membrane protein|uniref:SHOCT domain-containing protein n=1 Tax=Pseudonocardia sp. TaxID=60912 RepID=UPI00262C59D1|nr:SHOCT domain-containing protein [Pseudonocardia sp.]MCU1631201.1 hypothetical protein [Pseudonocardia sp.]MDT7699186.1 hypothetical protein [Pseudonocardiales bacterium]
MMHGGMLFGSLAWSFALLVLVLLGVAVAVVLVQRTGSTWNGGDHGRTEDALPILDVRLARGEIDAEEYDRLRTELTGRSHEVPRRDG